MRCMASLMVSASSEPTPSGFGSLGVTGAATKFLAATASETAHVTALAAHLPASVGGYVTPAAGIEVIVTNATAAIKENQKIQVYIPYVVD